MQQEAADVTRAIDDSKEPGAAEELAGLGALQRGLSERGLELIEKLQQTEPTQPPAQPGRPEGGRP